MRTYTAQHVHKQETAVKTIQEDILWKEKELEHKHPLLDKRYPPDYQEVFKEYEEEHLPLKTSLIALRRKHTAQRNALHDIQEGEKIVWAARFQQKIRFQKSPFSCEKSGGYYQSIDHACPEQLDHQTRNTKRWVNFSRQQRSSLFKVLQELYTDEEDLMLSTEKTPRRILDTEALNWVCINPERIADETYEKLSGESLEGMTRAEIVEKKSLFIPLLKKILKHARQIVQQEKRGRKKSIKKFFMINFPSHPISDGCILVLSTHEQKDRVINRPQVQVFRSAYAFQRSFLYTNTTLLKDMIELQEHGITLNLQVTDTLPATKEEEQEMRTTLSSVIEKIEGKTRKETYQTLQKLTAAAQTQDRKGRKNPPAKRLQLLSGRDRLEQGTTAIIHKKATIASYEDIFAKMLKEHETRLGKMKEIIDYFQATYPFPYPPEKTQLLVQKLESKIPSRENELPVMQPFITYYSALQKGLQQLKEQVDNPHSDHIPHTLDTMRYILDHFAVLQSVEKFRYAGLHTPQMNPTKYLQDLWEKNHSYLQQYRETLRHMPHTKDLIQYAEEWTMFCILLENYTYAPAKETQEKLFQMIKSVFDHRFIRYHEKVISISRHISV